MFRIPLLVVIALFVAFFGGIWSAQWALEATSGFGGLTVNNWTAYPDIQTADADPYARAHRANDGKLLLGQAEGLIFRAEHDKEGFGLDASCDYQLVGNVPPALFWTLRATPLDDAIWNLPGGRPISVNAHNVLHDEDGAILISLSYNAQAGNWLALEKEGPFELKLTLIDTPTSHEQGIRELEMPEIVRGECR